MHQFFIVAFFKPGGRAFLHRKANLESMLR